MCKSLKTASHLSLLASLTNRLASDVLSVANPTVYAQVKQAAFIQSRIDEETKARSRKLQDEVCEAVL